MSAVAVVPHSVEVEQILVGRLLRQPELIGEVVGGTLIEARDFYDAACRVIFSAALEGFFADEPVDPITVARLLGKTLGRVWGVDENATIQRVVNLAERTPTGSPVDHAKLIKRDSEYRQLLRLAEDITDRVTRQSEGPEEIAGIASTGALGVAMQQAVTNELVAFVDAGRAFVAQTRLAMAARQAGIELGAYYGLNAIDNTLRGHRPGELVIAGGEPGVGKSSVWWRAALTFARRQAQRPVGQRIGTLIVSLEMSPEPSNARFASMISGVSGLSIREGTLPERELNRVIAAWRKDKDVPLYMNYAPTLRCSQLRALVAEGIRRHNVGVVIIDHFRMFDLDQRLPNRNDEDEDKVRFLKEQIAMSMNVAVVCLAHTRKPDQGSNGRPKMSDLRGSYQVAAHSDYVGFVYRPAMYATRNQMDSGEVKETDAELIWAKTRHNSPGSARFYFDGASMMVADE